MSSEIIDAKGSLAVRCLPFIFLFMDSDTMFERGMELVYGKSAASFTGGDFIPKSVHSSMMPTANLSYKAVESIIETSLFTTAGDSILKVVFDSEGRLVPRSELKLLTSFKHSTLSGHYRSDGKCRVDDDHCLRPLFELEAGEQEIAQVQLITSRSSDDSSVRFIVEGDSHTLFEMRFYRINHRGDISIQSLADAALDEEP